MARMLLNIQPCRGNVVLGCKSNAGVSSELLTMGLMVLKKVENVLTFGALV